jgi:two-component system sensor histidine kinase PhoQ
MQQIIQRQLKRASLRSHSLLVPPVKIYPIVQSVLNALKKVYSSKNLDFVTDFDESCQARMNDSDLYELFGNLLDNACKWAQSRVTVNLTCDSRVTKILIQDDGPGFPHDASRLLERGMRADQQHSGQGLGLDMSLSIVTQSGGTLVLENTESGGAGVSIELPS